MAELPAALANALAGLAPETFAAGEHLLRPDQRAGAVYYLRSGLVRLYSLDSEGHEHNHGFHGADEWVYGQLDFSQGRICCADSALGVEALQPTRALRVSLAELERWQLADPVIASYLLQQLMAMNAQRLGREADLLQRDAEQRYRDLLQRQPDLLQHVQLQQVARWLGITPVALSRIRRRVHGVH